MLGGHRRLRGGRGCGGGLSRSRREAGGGDRPCARTRLERTLAVLTARERTACAASDQPAAWPGGFVRLTDAAGYPIIGPEAAVGALSVTFPDGRTLVVAPVVPLDPTLH